MKLVKLTLAGFIASTWFGQSATAQRAQENAVAEAADAFGTTVGREEIGLYSPSNARGFSPSQAGNLRINGLYFDQVQQLGSRIVRGSTVHVGISAQGFPFPAPTGVVDFHLRTPQGNTSASTVVGLSSYNQTYVEVDGQAQVVGNDVLNVGGGFGYQRNSFYKFAARSWEWTGGLIANWKPNDALVVTPFWSMQSFHERGHRPIAFISNAGFPRYRIYETMSQPWTRYDSSGHNFGVTAHYEFGDNFVLESGVFRSSTNPKRNQLAFLLNTNADGEGDYTISTTPPRQNASVSGETRITKLLRTEEFQNKFYVSVKGRDSKNEFGGAQTLNFGRGSVVSVPQVTEPVFTLGSTTETKALQATPGIGYDGVWKNVGQVSLGLQKTYYRRTTAPPGGAVVKGNTAPWLYNAAAAVYITRGLSAYGSYTRGFEEVGNAPFNAANRDEAAPAQLTKQVDAGLKYQITSQLQFVGGVFEITKPYFNLDSTNVFRRVGTTKNRGAEFSLAGNVLPELTVVAGFIVIDAAVKNDTGPAGSVTSTAVGPIPNSLRANIQYRPTFITGLTFDAKIERTSKRNATTLGNPLPAVTLFDAGVRYSMSIFEKTARARLQLLNLTNEYGVTPQASGQLSPLDGRRFEFSLAIDF
jgi:iron complex outermembrane receptor protein